MNAKEILQSLFDDNLDTFDYIYRYREICRINDNITYFMTHVLNEWMDG
jgi:hypothetical protein